MIEVTAMKRHMIQIVLLAGFLLLSLYGSGMCQSSEKTTIEISRLDFEKADIRQVIKTLGEIGHRNIILDQGIEGIVTIYLRDVTWEAALVAVLNMSNLVGYEENGFIKVLKRLDYETQINTLREKEKQKFIQLFNTFLFVAAMVIAGLDHRFNWSQVPLWLVILSDLIMLIGYILFIKTMIHNEYASRVIEIQKGQRLIDTGTYAIVRHPMYAAGILMYMFIPIALGSYWAMIPQLLIPAMLIFRLLDEEKALIAGLKGYKRYMKRVKYRLLPGIW